MKSIFTFLSLLFVGSAFAYDGGRISVTVSGDAAQIYIDGRAYNATGNTVTLENVQAGNHTVQVYRGYATANNNGRNAKNRKKNANLIYSTTVSVRPSYDVDVMVNRFGRGLVDEQLIQDSYNTPGRNGGYGDDDRYGNDGRYGNNGYHTAMSDLDFNQLVQKIRSQWLNKLSSAKSAVQTNYLSVAQTRQLVQIFSSERDRLDLVKAGYSHLVDSQNFTQLYDLFSRQGQTELDQYIRTADRTYNN